MTANPLGSQQERTRFAAGWLGPREAMGVPMALRCSACADCGVSGRRADCARLGVGTRLPATCRLWRADQ
jgi:hypothetical protein